LTDFEDLQREFNQLLVSKKYEEAEELVRAWAKSAADAGDPSLAAHWTGLRGSLHSIQHRDADALAAYEEAEQLQPQDGTRCLATASHLLYALGNATASLAKIKRALELLVLSPEHLYALPDALGLQAVVWLRLGREDQALERFAAFCRAAESGPLTQQIDLRLVAELIAKGTRVTDCASYLRNVLVWANRTRNADLNQRAASLLAKLEASHS
jgi:tetratricopeptide (TPR) repeat protein